MDNITFEAMPLAISELIQKVDTLQSTVAALQKHCSKQQVEQMVGIDGSMQDSRSGQVHGLCTHASA